MARAEKRQLATKDDPLAAIEAAIGHAFADRDLLRRALTHSSMRSHRGGGEDNERLEFLGDRVLGLAIAELLVTTEPQATEGDLARLFNRLVRKEACARIAREIGISEALILSPSEIGNGGRQKDTILADACEALLAAVFIEAGFEGAARVVKQLWSPLVSAARTSTVDPKSALQEWAQSCGHPLPKYKEVDRAGPDHAPRFRTEVRVGGFDPAEGEGASKRAAEQAAAAAMLRREGVWRPIGDG